MIPATLTPKIAKLIPMLATDKDGELVAAARAIGRALKSVDLDFHDLAAAISKPPNVVTVYRDTPRAEQSDFVPDTWAELARWLQERASKLQPNEASFVSDMAGRLWRSGEPSERQGAWMKSLYSKLLKLEAAS